MLKISIEDLPSSYILHSPNDRAIYGCLGVMALASGHHVIRSNPYFTPQTTLDAIEQCRPEMVRLVPAQVKLIAAESSLRGRNLESVRRLLLGGDIITTDLVE